MSAGLVVLFVVAIVMHREGAPDMDSGEIKVGLDSPATKGAQAAPSLTKPQTQKLLEIIRQRKAQVLKRLKKNKQEQMELSAADVKSEKEKMPPISVGYKVTNPKVDAMTSRKTARVDKTTSHQMAPAKTVVEEGVTNPPTAEQDAAAAKAAEASRKKQNAARAQLKEWNDRYADAHPTTFKKVKVHCCHPNKGSVIPLSSPIYFNTLLPRIVFG